MHHQRVVLDRVFNAGEAAPVSGVYRRVHLATGDHDDVVVLRGQRFSSCEKCGKAVEFRLLQAAPHISSDEDFCQETSATEAQHNLP